MSKNVQKADLFNNQAAYHPLLASNLKYPQIR